MAEVPAQVGGLVSSSVNDRRNRLFQDGQNLHQRGFIPEAPRRYGQALILQTNGQPGKDLEVPLDPSPRRQLGFLQ